MLHWRIEKTTQVEDWLDSLPNKDLINVNKVLDLLEKVGPLLGRPYVDRVHESKVHNLKELRIPSSTLRVIFAFGANRSAILLTAGDKKGAWNKWYVEQIRLAEELLAMRKG